MRILLAALMVALALSGCTNDESPSEPASTVPAETGGNETAVPPVEANTTNQPPILNVTVSELVGTAPWTVNFTIDAMDDGEMTWRMTVNQTEVRNGTSFPAAFEHTFEAGNWSVDVAVLDGEFVVNQTFQVIAAPAEIALEEVARLEGTAKSGRYSHSGELGAQECPGLLTGENGVGCFFAEVAPEFIGLNAVYSTTAATTRIAFFDTCATTGSATGSFTEGNPLELVIPAGTGCFIAWSSDTGDVGVDRTYGLVILA